MGDFSAGEMRRVGCVLFGTTLWDDLWDDLWQRSYDAGAGRGGEAHRRLRPD